MAFTPSTLRGAALAIALGLTTFNNIPARADSLNSNQNDDVAQATIAAANGPKARRARAAQAASRAAAQSAINSGGAAATTRQPTTSGIKGFLNKTFGNASWMPSFAKKAMTSMSLIDEEPAKAAPKARISAAKLAKERRARAKTQLATADVPATVTDPAPIAAQVIDESAVTPVSEEPVPSTTTALEPTPMPTLATEPGLEATTGIAPAPIPEPSTLAILGVMVGGFAMRALMKRRSCGLAKA